MVLRGFPPSSVCLIEDAVSLNNGILLLAVGEAFDGAVTATAASMACILGEFNEDWMITLS